MVKRALDLLMALAALLVLSPGFLAICVGIIIGDRGPVLYRGLRIGRSGHPFRMYKFRTMVPNADRLGGPSTAEDDLRITRVGRFLRKYKLDELPQLFNVLKGDMSLVGPRPEVPEEVSRYSSAERALLSVRPGMTDYASIRFHNENQLLNGSADAHETYRRLIRPEKIRLGLEYVRRASVATDLKILALTMKTLISSRLHARSR